MNNINSKGGSSPLDYLEIIANFAGVFAMFDSGGHTGYGDPSKISGMTHFDEIVFENKIVKNNRADLMALRSQLQKGSTVRDAIDTMAPRYLGGNSYSGQDLAPILSELSALRQVARETTDAIRNMPAPQVTLPEGLVTIDDALIQATPRVEKHFAQKNVD